MQEKRETIGEAVGQRKRRGVREVLLITKPSASTSMGRQERSLTSSCTVRGSFGNMLCTTNGHSPSPNISINCTT